MELGWRQIGVVGGAALVVGLGVGAAIGGGDPVQALVTAGSSIIWPLLWWASAFGWGAWVRAAGSWDGEAWLVRLAAGAATLMWLTVVLGTIGWGTLPVVAWAVLGFGVVLGGVSIVRSQSW